jgi:hypothetical protein
MLGASGPAAAQSLVAPPPIVSSTVSTPPIVAAPPLRSIDAARAQDAAAIADRLGMPVEEAIRHLRLQEATVPITDAIAESFADRLTGIAIEHRPDFHIVVTLTGALAEPERIIDIDGTPVRVTFRAGAPVSHTGLMQAITAYQAAIRASLIAPPGLGIDQRSGELVAVVSGRDVAREGAGPLAERLAAMTHVPVRLRVVDQPALDMGGIQGGARVVGQVPGDTHRYLCTAGFVVTDGSRTGLATAAHCPDELSGRDAEGHEQALPFVGQWGWGHQDVQINASATALAPLFFADTAKTVSRPVTGARGRAGVRAGDVVCHRGERTGYSCSQVELTDFAPAGDLCGGACLPTWTTVAGPVCKSGDSGSPVFLGDTAYGILKGGSYRSDGSCAFYFYMSTDYLPSGWRLLTAGPPLPAPSE